MWPFLCFYDLLWFIQQCYSYVAFSFYYDLLWFIHLVDYVNVAQQSEFSLF